MWAYIWLLKWLDPRSYIMCTKSVLHKVNWITYYIYDLQHVKYSRRVPTFTSNLSLVQFCLNILLKMVIDRKIKKRKITNQAIYPGRNLLHSDNVEGIAKTCETLAKPHRANSPLIILYITWELLFLAWMTGCVIHVRCGGIYTTNMFPSSVFNNSVCIGKNRCTIQYQYDFWRKRIFISVSFNSGYKFIETPKNYSVIR